MITEIGALVGILKVLLEAAKTGRELFGGATKKATAEAVKKTQERLAGIADQLYQSLALSKMLPIWLNEHATVNLYTDKLTTVQVKLLDQRLRQLISDSIHDHFSGVFFGTSFAVLPGVEAGIEDFRDRLKALEVQLNGIPAGDAVAWRRAWPTVKTRMQDLRREAEKLDTLSEAVQASLVHELREAAKLA